MKEHLLHSVPPLGWAAVALGSLALAGLALGNGGPFVIKYPGGDPAAKGVLARLDPDLKPAQETRLQVVKEDLQIRFAPEPFRSPALKGGPPSAPLALVTANYWITNPTPDSITVEFGFPILRGIYVSPFSMMPRPEAWVTVDGTNRIRPEIISNSAIYGALRRKAAADIERALQSDARLQGCVQAYAAEPSDKTWEELTAFLTGQRAWTRRDAELLADYLRLRPAAAPAAAAPTNAAAPGATGIPGTPFGSWWVRDASLQAATLETGWAVQAIGEQKATQWLTWLAGRLDPAAASSYEAIFEAWGGDVRERSVDLTTGKVRPRENSPAAAEANRTRQFATYGDSAVYARVDYLENNKKLTPEQKAVWQAVLKNLPVVFTFAPMNLLHYQVAFAPGSVRTVKVAYQQYAYEDTATPASYQLAYVLHPASLWKSFGPIQLTVIAPKGVRPVTTLPFKPLEQTPPPEQGGHGLPAHLGYEAFALAVPDKRGELFVGISMEAWAKAVEVPAPALPVVQQAAAK